MSDTLLYIVGGIFTLLFIYLLVSKKYSFLTLAFGVVAVILGFILFGQIPEDNLVSEIKMLNNEYEQKVQTTKVVSYILFFIGGIMTLLGLIFISKKGK